MTRHKQKQSAGSGTGKTNLVNQVIEDAGVEAYEGSVKLIHHQRGFRVAVVTSSQNCEVVLRAAKPNDCFEVKVDGNTRLTLNT